MNKIIILIIIAIAIAVYVSIDSENKRRQRIKNKIIKQWGKKGSREISADEYEQISHYFQNYIEKNDVDYVDNITWNDLDMDAVFKNMNICNSSVGQEYLYKMLRVPSDNIDELKEIDRLAEFFNDKEEQRLNIQKEYAELGITKKLAISDYIDIVLGLESASNVVHYVLQLAVVLSILLTIFVNPVLGIVAIIISVSVTIITYYRYKAEHEPYYKCVTQFVRMVETVSAIKKMNIKELEAYNKTFENIEKTFSGVVKYSSVMSNGNITGSPIEMAMDYLRMLTHVDIIAYNKIIKIISGKNDLINELIEKLGFIEATICVASFRKQFSYWSKPEFINNGTDMDAQELFHPLITNPVSNSIKTSKNILLTGSNASGKSTFLKTVAINAILSQSIYTSTSKKYIAPMYSIYSSMSLKDDLNNNDSYYIVEIKALKRIIDMVGVLKKPMLCFVDEVLRGTNTVERIAASSQILKNFDHKNVMSFAATHDIELTSILDKYYENYHFQEEVTDDVVFNYKLFKGPATTRNAIKLLKVIGYDKIITESAENSAKYFVNNGLWKVES